MTSLEKEFVSWAKAIGYYKYDSDSKKALMKTAFYSGVVVGKIQTINCKTKEEQTALSEEIFTKIDACQLELKKIFG